MPLFGPPDVEKLKARKDIRGLTGALGYQKDPSIRCSAARALGELKAYEVFKPLVNALKDSDVNVRRVSAAALGDFGSYAVGELIQALNHSDEYAGSAGSLDRLRIIQSALDKHAVNNLIEWLTTHSIKAKWKYAGQRRSCWVITDILARRPLKC
jgi:HEAT repeat protein